MERHAELIERETALSKLAGWLENAREGKGRLVLLAGEAGVGKTVLVAAFLEAFAIGVRLLSGACDGLFTPEPLAPLFDIADQVGGTLLAAAVASRPRRELFTSFLSEISRERPTVVVIEDVHWADEATLDLLRFLGRRLMSSRVLLIVTYRDDELGAQHPLLVLLGGLAGVSSVRRLELAPLSKDGLRLLAAGSGVDTDELYRLTRGNPLFATEVLATDGDGVPPSVRDAVLARAARLSPEGRQVLEASAVVGTAVEKAMLEMLVQNASAGAEDCVARGMLRFEGQSVCFRHELVRLAIEEALSPGRRAELHAWVLRVLRDRDEPDKAALAYHAEHAGDADACLRYSLVAAERASALGAHREAAAQYRRALAVTDLMDERGLVGLKERLAEECYLTGDLSTALELRQDALATYRRLVDRQREGAQHRLIAVLLYFFGRGEDAVAEMQQAVQVLEALPVSNDLALAYADAAGARASVDVDLQEPTELGSRAVDVAEELGDEALLAYALSCAGYVDSLAGRGTSRTERSLSLSLSHDFHDLACRNFLALTALSGFRDELVIADRWLKEGLEYATANDLETYRLYLVGWSAWSLLGKQRLDEAAEMASPIASNPNLPLMLRAVPLVVIGLLRARRGDPDPWQPLDEALPYFASSTIATLVRRSRAEAALLAGNQELARTEALALDPDRLADARDAGTLLVWAHRAGAAVPVKRDLPEQFSLELAGEHAAAAAAWEEQGAVSQATLTRAFSDDERLCQQAHAELLAIGASAAAKFTARRLRERGAMRVARGARPATRAHPAGLTAREVEVLRLAAAGLRSRQIADQLFLSPRTVDRHLSSIFRKLGVHSRFEAAIEAASLGLLQDE